MRLHSPGPSCHRGHYAARALGALLPLACAGLPLLVIAACGSKREPPPAPTATEVDASAPLTPEARVAARAGEALGPFKQQLAMALTSALKQGPEAAVDVCAKEAPRLAAQAAAPDVVVGRSAIRLRNPQNAARPWLGPVLSELAALPSAKGARRVVPLNDGRYGYAEAIVLQPQCTPCHGREIEPTLLQRIRARYPDDQATGFAPGQLRGAFWAEVSLPPAK